MLKQCLNLAKTLRDSNGHSRFDARQKEAEAQTANILAWENNQAKPIPRYLQLARAIHARFTDAEEKEMAIYRAAEALAARKNEIIMRAIHEVLDFCEVLRNVPGLNAMLDKKTEDITQRLFSNRCTFAVEHEPIAVRYEAPLYHVDLHTPDHVALTCSDNAYIHISFNPVKFMLTNNESEEISTITKHLLIKQYRIEANGVFLHFQSNENTPADPIAEILTELRAKLGHDFFENNLMPYFEAQAAERTDSTNAIL